MLFDEATDAGVLLLCPKLFHVLVCVCAGDCAKAELVEFCG